MADGAANIVDLRERELTRLEQLGDLDYAQERTTAARRLGMRAVDLDKEMKRRRPRDTEEKENPLQAALDLLVNMVRRYAEDQKIGFGYGGGSWHVYKHGVWRAMEVTDEEDFQRILAQMCPDVGIVYGKDAHVIERQLRSSMHFKLNTNLFDARPLVAVRNGTLNVDSGELLPHSPAHMITRYVDIDYSAEAACPEWEAMIRRTLDDYPEQTREQIVGFIQEWMGVAVAGGSGARTPRALRKALFLYGPPNSGKSTVFDVVRELLGTDRVVASRVDEVNDRFGLEAFLSASAWITEEVDDVRKAIGTSRVKCLITGEPVAVQRKQIRNATLSFRGPIGWAGNTAPNFTEASNAIYDRIIVVPMERMFTPEEAKATFGGLKPVEWLFEKDEFPGIFNWALAGYHRLLARGQFEDVNELRSAREAWREQNDVAYDFVRNYLEVRPGVRNTPEVLAWAALAYAKATRNSRWPEIPQLKTAINGAVRDAYPKVVRSRPRTEDGRPHAYRGLALTEAGLAYFKQAQTDNPASTERLRPNEAELFQARVAGSEQVAD